MDQDKHQTLKKAQQLVETGAEKNIKLAIQLLKSQNINTDYLLDPFGGLIKFLGLRKVLPVEETLCSLYSRTSFIQYNTYTPNQTDIPYQDYDPDDLDLPRKRLPDGIWRLVNLQKIDLYNYLIPQIPATVGQLKKLSSLDIQSCKLREIAPEIGGLDKLEELKLKDNALKELPDAFCSLHQLRLLDLAGNKIKSLPPSLYQLKTLNFLILENNPIPTSEQDRLRQALPQCTISF